MELEVIDVLEELERLDGGFDQILLMSDGSVCMGLRTLVPYGTYAAFVGPYSNDIPF